MPCYATRALVLTRVLHYSGKLTLIEVALNYLAELAGGELSCAGVP